MEKTVPSIQNKGMFKTWQKCFIEAYLEDGIQDINDGQVYLSCDPAWEARCFSAYPHRKARKPLVSVLHVKVTETLI